MPKKTSDQNGLFGSKRLLYGSYSVGLILGLVALVILLNVLVSSLDTAWGLRLDLTENRLFSLTKETNKLLNNLKSDIHIYTLFQPGEEDARIVNTLSRYSAQSPHIKLQNVDPIRNPTLVSRFKSDAVTELSRNWIVVTDANEKKVRVIQNNFTQSVRGDPESDLYKAAYDPTGKFVGYNVLIESRVTAAILFVSEQNSPKIYFLQGHGEAPLASITHLTSQLEGANYDVRSINLQSGKQQLTQGDMVICLGPKSDLKQTEKEALRAFMIAGGKALFAIGASNTSMPNFEGVFGAMGADITLQHQLVMEDNPDYFYRTAACPLPVLQQHDITREVAKLRQPIFAFYAQSLNVPPLTRADTKVTKLLLTSGTAFAKADTQTRDEKRASGDAKGPFVLGVALQYTPEDAPEAFMAIYSSDQMFISSDLASSGTANQDLFFRSITFMYPFKENIAVEPKTTVPNRLQTSEKQSKTTALIVCVALPLAVMGFGMFIFLRRRHK